MEPQILKKTWYIVENAEAARALTNVKQQRYLLPFICEELSLSEAARRLEVKPNALLYHLNKLLALGLLVVTQVKQRRGRASKLYRASAERFFIPFSLTQADTVESLSSGTSVQSERRFQRDLIAAEIEVGDDWGVAIYVMADGGLSIDLTASRDHPAEDTDFVLNAEHPAIWSSWLEVNLGLEEAKALQRELVALWSRYKQMRNEDEQKYTLRLGLAPAEESVS